MNLNKRLEIDLKIGKAWNKARALNEKKAIDIFWSKYRPTKVPEHW